jgi:hypothetical protein
LLRRLTFSITGRQQLAGVVRPNGFLQAWTFSVVCYFKKAAISAITSCWCPTHTWPPLG